MQVVRAGKVLELTYILQQSRPLVPALHGVECVPSYFIVAGLVFVPLSIPFLEHAYGSKLSSRNQMLNFVVLAVLAFISSFSSYLANRLANEAVPHWAYLLEEKATLHALACFMLLLCCPDNPISVQ